MTYRKKWIIITLVIVVVLILGSIIYFNMQNKKDDNITEKQEEHNHSKSHKHEKGEGVNKNNHSSKEEIRNRAESYIEGDMEIGNIVSSFRTGFIDPKSHKTIFIIQENGIEGGLKKNEKDIHYKLHVADHEYKLKKTFQGHTFTAYETTIQEKVNDLPPSINVTGESSGGKAKVSFSSGDLGEQNLNNLNEKYLREVYKEGSNYARNKDKVRYIEDIVIKDIRENISNLNQAIKSTENDEDKKEMKKTVNELKKDINKAKETQDDYNDIAKKDYNKYQQKIKSIEYFEPFVKDELHIAL